MLSVGLTGGIGSGKSAVASRLARRGAAVVDADALAREVVAPGTPGLATLVAEFGDDVLLPDGSLDRAGLGRRVFAEPDARAVLNSIVHPLVRARTVELAEAAERTGAVVLVQDVPLLVESGLAPAHHLVVVVEAPLPERLRRLTELRGLPEQDAHARVAAQATDERRRELADVVLANSRGLPELDERVEQLWSERLVPYAANLGGNRRAPRAGARLVPPDASWEAAGHRLVERLRWLCGPRALAVEHVGSTAVPGLPAQDVIDLQVEVADLEVASELADTLAEGGFPGLGRVDDPPRPDLDPDPAAYRTTLHVNADPGRAADVRVRTAGSTSARAAVALRGLLRRDESARETYARAKARLTAQHPDVVEAYAEAKAPVLVPLLVRALQAR